MHFVKRFILFKLYMKFREKGTNSFLIKLNILTLIIRQIPLIWCLCYFALDLVNAWLFLAKNHVAGQTVSNTDFSIELIADSVVNNNCMVE